MKRSTLEIGDLVELAALGRQGTIVGVIVNRTWNDPYMGRVNKLRFDIMTSEGMRYALPSEYIMKIWEWDDAVT
jgi:hypothetical protein